MTGDEHPNDRKKAPQIPALFATIHFRSPKRPNGYTAEDIEELNRILNTPVKPENSAD